MTILIIGATGYIGSEIYKYAKQDPKVDTCIGTKFRSEGEEYVEFDILKSDISAIDKMVMDDDKYALICSADTNIDFCSRNYDMAYEKNVTATIALIERLKNMDYHIIYFSTDNVFNGEKGNYTEEDAPHPINEYGKMKAEIEKYLLQEVSKSCIMRLGKIVGNFTRKNDLLMEWHNKAEQKEIIHCIRDNILTITHVDDIANCFFLIIERKLTGLYNIVGNRGYARKELCMKFLEYINLKAVVKEIPIKEFPFLEKRPLNLSMLNTKFTKETGYRFMELEEIWARFARKK